MDARTSKKAPPAVEVPHAFVESSAKRDRLLASIALIAGLGIAIALPFALRAGAEFFMPVTAALVIAITLVPMLEWFERRGVPSRLAAGLCIIFFLLLAVFAVGSIVLPAIDWVALIPERIPKVQAALDPVLDLYKAFDRFVDRIFTQITVAPEQGRTVRIETPNSLSGLLATSAPHLLIQLFFALLVIFFFLAGWTSMRKRTIVSRGSFEGALTTARVIQQVVDATSIYIGTITLINVTLGALTALILWQLGMDSPVMWGGIVAVLNFIPYLGPIGSALLLFFGGLMTFPDVWSALLPPLDLHRPSPGRGELHHADGRRQEADHQPARDPGFLELLGLGVGDDGRAAGRSAADHHEDDFRGGRNARHRRLPVRARHLDPCGRGGGGKRDRRC